MEILRFLTHYGFHFLFPGLIAYLFFKDRWKKVWLLLLATMLIDLDHLLAEPVYVLMRCSINFHPLHSYYALMVYLLLLFFNKTRIIGIGLVLHFFTDWVDCLFIP